MAASRYFASVSASVGESRVVVVPLAKVFLQAEFDEFDEQEGVDTTTRQVN